MRRVRRAPLPAEVLAVLTERTRGILQKRPTRRAAEAARLWESRVQAMEVLVAVLRDEMAAGPGRCMYCEGGEGDQIDHFWPRSAWPERTYEWENLLWACSPCNRHKRDRFPLDAAGKPLLLNPTDEADRPREHLRLAPRTGALEALTARGQESAQTYGLNRPLLQRDRSRVFASLQVLVERYDEHLSCGEVERAEEVRGLLSREPHASVLIDLVEVADSPAADVLLRPTCRAALARRPEVRHWFAGW